jgi:hypothetical protein
MVFGTGQPTKPAIRWIINNFKKMGLRKCVWLNMRSEPVIYVNGHPYAPADPDRLTENLALSPDLSAEHIELLQHEYVSAVKRNIKRDGGGAEFEYHKNTYALLPADRKDIIKREAVSSLSSDVLSVTKLYEEDINSPAFRVIFRRLPINDERAISPAQLDKLTMYIDQYTDEHTAIVFNCQMGKGRTSLAMICACLLKHFMHHSKEEHSPAVASQPLTAEAGGHESQSTVSRMYTMLRGGPAASGASLSTSDMGVIAEASTSEIGKMSEIDEVEYDEESSVSKGRTPTLRGRFLSSGTPDEASVSPSPSQPSAVAMSSATSQLWPSTAPDMSHEEKHDFKKYMQRLEARKLDEPVVVQSQLTDLAEAGAMIDVLSESERRAGNYTIVRNIVDALTREYGLPGQEIKWQVDRLIDSNQHLQNMRVCISLTYSWYANESRDRRDYWLTNGKHLVERYAVLILYGAYLKSEFDSGALKSKYSEWIADKKSLLIDKCIGSLHSGPLSTFHWN